MLTADLVRAYPRGDRLSIPQLKRDLLERMRDMSQHYIELIEQHVGEPLEQLKQAFADAETTFKATDKKVFEGLKKLLLDRCDFEMGAGVDPVELRRAVFTAATRRRRELQPGQLLQRQEILAQVAAELELDVAVVESGLYSDLKAEQLLQRFEPISAEALIELYQRSQAQAVLLRAVSVDVEIEADTPAGYRRLFHALKFRRLLHSIQRRDAGGYRIHIDGPMSLFGPSTKYGLQLALILPVLDEVGTWQLDAQVRWGKARRPLALHLEGGGRGDGGGKPPDAERALPDEVAKLLTDCRALETPWQVEISNEILDLPGIGVCVPDLIFTHKDGGAQVLLEVLGHWSREAVFKRVDLVQAGLARPILFAVSEKLRVSEKVLDATGHAALYVYKRSMRAKAVLERVATLCVR